MSEPSSGERLASLARKELDELRVQMALARLRRDRAVHRTRKTLQRLRAIVMLLRPVDEQLAARENLAMRKLRHRLASLRDAEARRETFHLLARRGPWKEFASDLRALAEREAKRHAAAWAAHPRDSGFWDSLDQARAKLAERAERWPFDKVDRQVIGDALGRAERRVRKRARAAHGETGRMLRHDLRRKLRRYANQKRAAAIALDRDDEDVRALLALAKRCGHEGDLWLALASARKAARERPEWKPLVSKLEKVRRAQCRRHDVLLKRMLLD